MKLHFLLLISCALLFKEGSACAPDPVAETTAAPTEGTEATEPPDTTAPGETTPAADTTPSPSDPVAECLGDGVTCKALKDGKGTRAETGDELECDFDGAPGCDCWANKKPDDDQNEWVECSGKVDPKAVQACFKTSDVPSGKFIATYVTTKEESGAQAILFSCTVTCAMGGTMTVKQWTKNADLKACAQSRLDALASPVCQEFQTDGAQTIEFLPKGQKYENFDVQLTASDFIGDDGGIAVIDDIKVYLDECVDTTVAPEETTAEGATTPAGTAAPGESTTIAGEKSDACSATCGVNSEVPCEDVFDFDNQEGGATATWRIYENEQAGNFDSGVPIPEEGKFYGAEVGPGDVALMLFKTPVKLEGKQFRLRHYDATDGALIRMCLYDEGEQALQYEDCGVESDLGWSEDDLEWKTAFSHFDTKALTDQARFHMSCDNENGQNYGACGFTDLAVVDEGAPQEETGPLQCTP